MQVQLGGNGHAGAHDGPHPGQQVTLGIGVAVGDHGAVQVQQHRVDRHRPLQVGQDLVAQRGVGGL